MKYDLFDNSMNQSFCQSGHPDLKPETFQLQFRADFSRLQ